MVRPQVHPQYCRLQDRQVVAAWAEGAGCGADFRARDMLALGPGQQPSEGAECGADAGQAACLHWVLGSSEALRRGAQSPFLEVKQAHQLPSLPLPVQPQPPPTHLSGATMTTVSPLYCVSSSDSSWRTRTSTSLEDSCTVPSTLGAGRLRGWHTLWGGPCCPALGTGLAAAAGAAPAVQSPTAPQSEL